MGFNSGFKGLSCSSLLSCACHHWKHLCCSQFCD